MTQNRTMLALAEEADSLYETAITRWVEQQPELAAQAKKIMDDVTECFDPEVAEALTKMRSLPWGAFIAWYESKYGTGEECETQN
ncbi:hypothetical protein K3N39_004227 [Escherichia coli]|nr:hypothetical protein [Escherichia coli]